jgi:hypothetical protein
VLFDQARELVVFADDPLDAHWVTNLMRSAASWSDGSAVATIRRPPLGQRQQAVFQRQLDVDQVGRQALRVERIDVDQRREGLGQGVRQVAGRHRAGLDQLGNEGPARRLGLAMDVLGHLLAELAGHDQHPADAGQGAGQGILEVRVGDGHLKSNA